MKVLCIESSNAKSVINIQLEPGRYYNIEDASKGTSAQNRLFHAMITEYYKSGLHDCDGGWKDLRNLVKRDLGARFESYVYATIEDGKPRIHQCDTYEEIPESVRKDPDLKKMVRGRLKSWGDYTKKERRNTIDNLKTEMLNRGVATKKFDEIIQSIGGVF